MERKRISHLSDAPLDSTRTLLALSRIIIDELTCTILMLDVRGKLKINEESSSVGLNSNIEHSYFTLPKQDEKIQVVGNQYSYLTRSEQRLCLYQHPELFSGIGYVETLHDLVELSCAF
uniref:Uncharacterized protein n=1 Tax=Micrurus spixii TaxID=129469 RepID=A0A2D4N8S3_9SAUR